MKRNFWKRFSLFSICVFLCLSSSSQSKILKNTNVANVENDKLILKKHQTCTFKKYYSFVSYDYSFSTIVVNNNEYTYPSNFFILLKEYRRQKMKKIFKNKNI